MAGAERGSEDIRSVCHPMRTPPSVVAIVRARTRALLHHTQENEERACLQWEMFTALCDTLVGEACSENCCLAGRHVPEKGIIRLQEGHALAFGVSTDFLDQSRRQWIRMRRTRAGNLGICVDACD